MGFFRRIFQIPTLSYIPDRHLEFMRYLNDDDLDKLVCEIIKNKDEDVLSKSEEYKKHQPNHSNYWELIAAQIQRSGGNAFVNTFYRGGQGKYYKEILEDVLQRIGEHFTQYSPVEVLEEKLVFRVIRDLADPKSTGETMHALRKFAEAKDLSRIPYETFSALVLLPISALGGPGGLSFWIRFIISAGGPAYSLTIPALIHIAFLRVKAKTEACSRQLQGRVPDEDEHKP